MTWLFADALDLPAITVKRILSREGWIAFVSHDADDGGWQFLTGEPVCKDDAAVVSLRQIVELDRSVEELADLPTGWLAWRALPTSPWHRKEKRNRGHTPI